VGTHYARVMLNDMWYVLTLLEENSGANENFNLIELIMGIIHCFRCAFFVS